MNRDSWSENVHALESKYQTVAEVYASGSKGRILHVPSRLVATNLPNHLLSKGWNRGICCKHLFRQEIEKAKDLNFEKMGFRAWGEDESWIALFEVVDRNQIFPIIEHLCDDFSNEEVALIENLFADEEWCTPLKAYSRLLEIAVSDCFQKRKDLGKWYKYYKDVSHHLYGNSASKADLKRSLSSTESIFFVNRDTSG
jgi:hypothetical protein